MQNNRKTAKKKSSQFQFFIKTHTHIILKYDIQNEEKEKCIIDVNNKQTIVCIFYVMG